jgi:hypothetical protein
VQHGNSEARLVFGPEFKGMMQKYAGTNVRPGEAAANHCVGFFRDDAEPKSSASDQECQSVPNGNLFARTLGREPSLLFYSIDSTGSATYQSFPYSDERTGVPYSVEFVATAATRSTIFRLTEQLHFFKGHFGSANHAPKNASIKTLTFREGRPDKQETDNQITYSSSGNAMIRQLTSLFERISATLEFGRRLTNLHQQHNRGIDTELKRMERMAKQGQLRELQATALVLSEIASDTTLDKLARQRAEAILKYSSTPRP